MKAQVNKVVIELVEQDIFSLNVDAVANQTDSTLTLAPSLLARAGSSVAAECRQIGHCDVGSAVITSAGALPFKKLIHVVGPRWGEGSERGKLASATWECLHLCEEYKLASVALPALSTGALGYPVENCATTMLSQIIDFTFEDLNSLRRVLLCLDDPIALDIFQSELEAQLGELGQSGDGKVHV
jgi:O-acetyl-ADP-ribose deacetylase